MSRIIQDGSLHVCIFNKDFTRLESYFKTEILVLFLMNYQLIKNDCPFGVNFSFKQTLCGSQK